MADEHKICFIICTNNEQRLLECIMYLSLLHIPDGYNTDVITVTDAISMAAGYNEAMRASNAKYKIYLHQDTFIVEPCFLDDMLKLFQADSEIGIVGITRNREFSVDKSIWHENDEFVRWVAEMMCDETETPKYGYEEVEAVDGLLMATQYDLAWREDLFCGFDFYDISQCMEFKRAGYKTVIPKKGKDWVIHTCGIPSLWNYNDGRGILLQEYPEITDLKGNRKHILFLNSKEIQLYGIPFALIRLGHDVFVAKEKITLANNGCADRAEREMIEELLEAGNFDMVVTYDFSQGLSDVCQTFKIPYYACVYDDPLLELYSKAALNEINYISVFDRKQYERLNDLGIKNLFYLPLAADVDFFGVANIDERDVEKYSCDISFVGRLYSKSGFEQTFDECGKEYLEEAEALIRQMDCSWNENTTIFGKASEKLIHYMIAREPENTWKAWNIDKRYFCESMILARKCNETERIRILQALQSKFSVVLYADESANQIVQGVNVRSEVEYGSEMPKIFYLSKINLNISSRSIESGIPQRVWDILAVGGFCLTNYQPELEEYFEIGKDLEVYHNLEELEEKAAYYLTHEKERIRIAINGYKKVRKEHDLKLRLQKALEIIFSKI